MARLFKPKIVNPLDELVSLEHHGAAILFLVREKIVRDWSSLCREFGFDPKGSHSGHLGLRDTVSDLIDAGLLVSENGLLGPYELTENWGHIQHALGISLVQAANLTYHESIAARPLLGKPKILERAPHVFVVMPFKDELRPVYDRCIKKVCRDLKLSVERADDVFSASSVVDDVWTAIYNAGVIIADCTGRNANVFYEIGLAHAVGKNVILIAQARGDVPFDISYIRYIRYSQSENGLRKLEVALRKTLKEVGKSIWAA